jgi:hypothetical protein
LSLRTVVVPRCWAGRVAVWRCATPPSVVMRGIVLRLSALPAAHRIFRHVLAGAA